MCHQIRILTSEKIEFIKGTYCITLYGLMQGGGA